MRKNVFGRKLKRDKNQRKALFKSLISSLVLKERIKTTESKAKSIKGQIDKLVSLVKKNGVMANNALQTFLAPNAMDKFISDTATRFAKRNGGYTRIIKIGKRQDGSLMVYLEWTEVGIKNQELGIKNDKKAEKSKKENKKPAITETRKKPRARSRKLSVSK